MNVQTLPPGYKTAPWTPPEKITGAMLAEATAKLIELLRIRTQPIGMRLFEDPADMDKIQGVRKPTDGMKFTMCQMVTQSRCTALRSASPSTIRAAAIAAAWSGSIIQARVSSRATT